MQTLLGIALASVVRGNHLLAAAGTWISNPITYLPLYWFNYQVGCCLLGKGQIEFDLSQLNGQDLWTHGWTFSSRLLIGSTLVGGIAAALTSGITYGLLKKQPKAKQRNLLYRRSNQRRH
jgi:hypothetical protein